LTNYCSGSLHPFIGSHKKNIYKSTTRVIQLQKEKHHAGERSTQPCAHPHRRTLCYAPCMLTSMKRGEGEGERSSFSTVRANFRPQVGPPLPPLPLFLVPCASFSSVAQLLWLPSFAWSHASEPCNEGDPRVCPYHTRVFLPSSPPARMILRSSYCCMCVCVCLFVRAEEGRGWRRLDV